MNSYEFLMTPGPTEIALKSLQAMVRPAIGPTDPRFIDVMDETENLLKQLLRTNNEVVFFPGSGRVSIESAFLSVLEPGDKILTITNGVFGKWLKIIAERLGVQPVELSLDWRRSIDPHKVEEKLQDEKDIKLVAVVHNETSTGVKNPVEEIGKVVKDYGALYLVDTVSSAGGDLILTDEWNVDLNCTGCYKCIGSPPGLAIVSVSEEAWDTMANRKTPARSFAFDLYRWLQMWIDRERGGKLIWGYRRHPIEPAPHLTYALNETLKMILMEGLEKRVARSRVAGKALRAAVREMGLELYPLREEDASNTVTVFMNPKGVRNEDILKEMREEFGVIIANGLEETFEKVFRIAHMGITLKEMYIIYTIQALGSALKKHGYRSEIESAIEAARKVFRSR